MERTTHTSKALMTAMRKLVAQGLGAGAASGLPAMPPLDPGMANGSAPDMGMTGGVDGAIDGDLAGGMDAGLGGDADGSQPFTLGSLAQFIDADPDGAMEMLRQKLPNASVQWTTDDGKPVNTELWSLLEADNWRSAGQETKGRVLGLIMNNLPPEMKAEETDGSEDSTVIPANFQSSKIASVVSDSDAAIRKFAEQVAAKGAPRPVFNGLAKKAQRVSDLPASVSVMYGEDSRTYEPNTGMHLDINQGHVVERNKSWGIKPDDVFSRHNIDYETFWRTNIMDKFYDGWIKDRFEVIADPLPALNKMNYEPGQRRQPARATLLEGKLEESRGRKSFNWLTASRKGTTTTKTANMADMSPAEYAASKTPESGVPDSTDQKKKF